MPTTPCSIATARALMALALGSSIFSTVHAEITLDGTLGPSGALPGPDFEIPAAAGEQVGGNLFHSFGVFNINTGESATFTGPDGISNVIGRVTGGSQSIIDGALNSEIPGADLYLISPAGMMFGENATLNVQGSFHASTADYVRLGQDGVFSAADSQASTLSVAPPSSFGFLGEHPTGIVVDQSILEVPEREAFSLVGGDIKIIGGPERFIFAPSGQINLASVASSGEALLDASGVSLNGFERLGNIEISNVGLLDVSGAGGGRILVRGGNLTVSNSRIYARTSGRLNGRGIDIYLAGNLVASNGAQIQTVTLGEGNAGNIVIAADNVALRTGALIDTSSQPEATVIGRAGHAGSLTITANGSVLVSSQNSEFLSGLYTNTFDDGDAGNLIISAQEISIQDGIVDAGTQGRGVGGDVNLTTTEDIMTANSGIRSNADDFGPGGNVTITTGGTLTLDGGAIQATTEGAANGGNVTVYARDMTLSDGAQIGTFIGDAQPDGTVTGFKDGTGNGGDLVIIVTDTLMLSGLASRNSQGTGLATTAQTGLGDGGKLSVSAGAIVISGNAYITGDTNADAKGDAGDIVVSTGTLSLRNGGQISAVSETSGAGGNVSVTAAGDMLIAGRSPDPDPRVSGIISTANDSGRAGNVSVAVAGALTMNGNTTIQSSTDGAADGGSVTIRARDLTLTGGAQITTGIGDAQPGGSVDGFENGAGSSGNLTVMVADTLSISGRDPEGFESSLTTTAQIGRGDAGDLFISAGRLILSDDGAIGSESNNKNSGEAGDITIDVAGTARLEGGLISAFAEQTDGGNITLTTDSAQLTRGSEITSSVSDNPDTVGGNVTINGGSLVVLDGSQVTASAGQGDGGRITVNSQAFFFDAASVDDVLNATGGEFGNDGMVEVNSPENDISGSITRLPASFLDAAALLSRRCAARDADEASSFVIVGRGGVPRGPDDWALGSYGNDVVAAEMNDPHGGAEPQGSLTGADAPSLAHVPTPRLSCAR